MKRKIIKINHEKCNGCGDCIPNCPEGAIQIIDGKARLISDLFCDGLGACINECPQNAIEVEEREAEPYDEEKVLEENIIPQGKATIKAHLKHLLDHGETDLYNQAQSILQKHNINIKKEELIKSTSSFSGSCPGSMQKNLGNKENKQNNTAEDEINSELNQWPIQLQLINSNAAYLDNADLLICADCVPFAYGDFHRKFLNNKIVIVFCPKLDHKKEVYINKLTEIFKSKNINSVSVVKMEVPCCSGTLSITNKAVEESGKNIDLNTTTISLNGNIMN